MMVSVVRRLRLGCEISAGVMGKQEENGPDDATWGREKNPGKKNLEKNVY